MVYTVVCYKETGFSRGNIPSSPAVLENAAKITLQANQIWKLQDRFLSQVKLSMSWDDAKDVDYMKVGDSYYTIEGVEMSNGNVAVFTLAMDPITTVGGVSSFTLIDGWVKRASPPSDDLFDNILPEPWVPRNEMVMDGPVSMTASNYEGVKVSYVCSSIDLNETESIAEQYMTASGDASVTVPQVSKPGGNTTIKLVPDDKVPEGWNIWNYRLPSGAIYYTITHMDGIAKARSLGLLDAITASYSIPIMYAQAEIDVNYVKTLIGQIHEYDATDMKYQYGSYRPKNKKVFALYNIYEIRAAVGGEVGAFEGRELYSGGQYPGFWIYADPSPEGRPYCQPIWYKGNRTISFQNSISGAQWSTDPITLYGNPSLSNEIAYNRSVEDLQLQRANLMADAHDFGAGEPSGNVLQYLLNTLSGTGRSVASMSVQSFGGMVGVSQEQRDRISGLITGGGQGLGAVERLYRSADRAAFDFQTSRNIVAPNISFGRFAQMQDYVGNGFYIDRIRLSENDMERFDQFLTMYGYADDRRLESTDFTSHVHFNFVQASNVAVDGPSMYMCNLISDYFSSGVRLWHELPNRAAMSDNPIKGGA